MLLSKTTKIKWNSKNKKHYVDLGYEYSKMNDEFEVDVNHLTNGSIGLVKYKCDYCGEEYEIPWQKYLYKKKKSVIKTDCCEKCLQRKAKECVFEKFGTYNIREVSDVNEKIKQTNIEKFGCENPFGNKDIQKKIKKYYIENYGVEYNMQISENVQKAKQTSLERYGVENYGALWSKQHKGELSPVWKGSDVKHERTERQLPEYRDWRKNVFDRDKYTCQCCGARNGNGKYIRLEAHHIYNWKKYPEKRFDTNNGITLCQGCHLNFHTIYGKLNNDSKQLEEFLNKTDKKIC